MVYGDYPCNSPSALNCSPSWRHHSSHCLNVLLLLHSFSHLLLYFFLQDYSFAFVSASHGIFKPRAKVSQIKTFPMHSHPKYMSRPVSQTFSRFSIQLYLKKLVSGEQNSFNKLYYKPFFPNISSLLVSFTLLVANIIIF